MLCLLPPLPTDVTDIVVGGHRVAQTQNSYYADPVPGPGDTRLRGKFSRIAFRPARPGEDAPAAIDAWEAKGPGGDSPYWAVYRYKQTVLELYKADWKPGCAAMRFFFPGRGFVMEATLVDEGGQGDVWHVVQHIRFDPTSEFEDLSYPTVSSGPTHAAMFARAYPNGGHSGLVLYADKDGAGGTVDRYPGAALRLFAAGKGERDGRVGRLARSFGWNDQIPIVSIRRTGGPERVTVLGRPFERRRYDMAVVGLPNRTLVVHFRSDGSGFALALVNAHDRDDYAAMLRP